MGRSEDKSADACATSLDDLLRSCASITSKALSYRPATSNHQHNHPPISSSNDTEAILDAKILNAQIHLRTSAAAAAEKRQHPDAAMVQQDLIDENLRLQQEHLLLHRLQLSRQATTEIDPDWATLRTEAARARDRQVQVALQQHRDLDSLRSQVQSLELNCHQQRLENRALFQNLLLAAVKTSSPGGADNVAVMETIGEDNDKEKSRLLLKQKNSVLGSLLKDLVAGSGLDWWSDERLQNILTRSVNGGEQNCTGGDSKEDGPFT